MSSTANDLVDVSWTPSTGFARWAFLAWFTITVSWWALAFAPLPVPEQWLQEVRAVCFGTLPDGLPDNWGWILLILAPLSMLTFLLAVWGTEVLAGFHQMLGRWSGRILIGTLALIAGTGLVSVGGRVLASERLQKAGLLAAETEPLPRDFQRVFEVAPEIPLIDQHGSAFSLAQLRGRPVWLTFAYGKCELVCPALVNTIQRAADAYPGPAPATVVVTLDPWRDTPSSLPTLFRTMRLERLPQAVVLSGEIEEVVRTVDAYEVGFSRDARTGDIAHPGMIFVLDPEGRIAYRFLNPPARWLVEGAVRTESRG